MKMLIKWNYENMTVTQLEILNVLINELKDKQEKSIVF